MEIFGRRSVAFFRATHDGMEIFGRKFRYLAEILEIGAPEKSFLDNLGEVSK